MRLNDVLWLNSAKYEWWKINIVSNLKIEQGAGCNICFWYLVMLYSSQVLEVVNSL